MNYCKIKSGRIVSCFGITKFPDNGNYAMVLSYKQEGNLRDYLCESLYQIHEKDLIHCDLHSGNILIEGSICLITDLWGYVDQLMMNHQVKYMDILHLRKKKHRKESHEITWRHKKHLK